MTTSTLQREQHLPITVSLVRAEDIPAPIREVAAMPDADYVDVSVLPVDDADSWSPDEWARAILESSPSARRFAFIPWQVLLGLRLGPWPSPDHVHGWRIADRGDDWVRIEASSWLMTCHAVARVEEERVTVALLVHYDNPIAALWWPPLSVVHRQAMPVILRQGAHALRERKVAS
jgi:hypothetical protein